MALARSLKGAAETAHETGVAPLAERTAPGFSRMEQAGDTAGIAASELAGMPGGAPARARRRVPEPRPERRAGAVLPGLLLAPCPRP